MAALHAHILNSLDDVESTTTLWNDLWLRSDVTPPLARGEFLRPWLECFAPGQRFRAIVVEEGNHLVAALPLATSRWGKLISVGGLPRNDWSGAGDLLIDQACDVRGALRLITSILGQLDWPIYRFRNARVDSAIWRSWLELLPDSSLRFDCRASHAVKLIPIPRNWDTYGQTWSRDHRQRTRRMFRRLREQGDLQFRRYTPTTEAEAESLLGSALEIENAGWKGREGTSLLQQPEIARFVANTSKFLLPRRELEVAFLELDGRRICFQILWNSKGVLHAYKGSYDEAFQQFGPGHLLIHELLRDACETQRCTAYDCLGPTSPALDQWRGTTYRTGHVTISSLRWLGKAMLFSYGRYKRLPPRRHPCAGADRRGLHMTEGTV